MSIAKILPPMTKATGSSHGRPTGTPTMKHLIQVLLLSCLSLMAACTASAQAKPVAAPAEVAKVYERLLPQIDRIPIYDNHSHATFPDDSDMDAQAAPPDESSVLRLRDTNPEFIAAAKSLFGYPYDDFQPEHAKWLVEKEKAAEKDGGTAYWDSTLEKLKNTKTFSHQLAMR